MMLSLQRMLKAPVMQYEYDSNVRVCLRSLLPYMIAITGLEEGGEVT